MHRGPRPRLGFRSSARVRGDVSRNGEGVPNDPDDTAGTSYDRHHAPRRLASPECPPHGIALCIRDTAEAELSVDCCINDERQTKWLVFAAARDSMQLFLEPTANAYLTMSPRNAAGAVGETALRVDAGVTLEAPKKTKIAIAPASLMPAGDTAALRRFAVDPGSYRVLLVRDTSYVACRLPCTRRTVFGLHAGRSVAIRP